MFDEEKNKVDGKEKKKQTSNDIQESAFLAGKDDNILDRSKKGLEKSSWFQRLFK